MVRSLPSEPFTRDFHCAAKWTKRDTGWEGNSVNTLLGGIETDAAFPLVSCDGGLATNLPQDDVAGGRAWIASGCGGKPKAPEHGGPARPLLTHRSLWTSAKRVSGLVLAREDRPGLWATLGYGANGDPWRERRYRCDGGGPGHAPPPGLAPGLVREKRVKTDRAGTIPCDVPGCSGHRAGYARRIGRKMLSG